MSTKKTATDQKQKELSTYTKKYREECIPVLMKEFQYKNIMECPRLVKIVLNTSMKEATQYSKILVKAGIELCQSAGQKPVLTKAKKSISKFKWREGQAIGCCLTLRRARM